MKPKHRQPTKPETAAPTVVQGETTAGPAGPQRSGQSGSPPAMQSGSMIHPGRRTAALAAPPAGAPESAPSPPAEVAATPGAFESHRFHTVRTGEFVADRDRPVAAGRGERRDRGQGASTVAAECRRHRHRRPESWSAAPRTAGSRSSLMDLPSGLGVRGEVRVLETGRGSLRHGAGELRGHPGWGAASPSSYEPAAAGRARLVRR